MIKIIYYNIIILVVILKDVCNIVLMIGQWTSINILLNIGNRVDFV